MSYTDFWENETLDHLFGHGNRNYTSPTISVGLSTTTIIDAGTGETEPPGGYLRQLVNDTNWTVSSGGSLNNGAAIVFPTATASWGTITHAFVNDNNAVGTASGNMLAVNDIGDVAVADTLPA